MKQNAWLLTVTCALGAFALVAAAGGRAAKPQPPAASPNASPIQQELAARSRFHKPPKVVSLVKSLRVERTEIESSDSGDHLLLTLRNDSEKVVACISFCSMVHELGYSSRTECSRTFVSPGSISQVEDAVPAYGERTDRIPAVAFDPVKPYFVCAATFTDGTQEGDKRVLEGQTEFYEEVKEQRRKRKGAN